MLARINLKRHLLIWVAVMSVVALIPAPVSAKGGFVHGIVIEVDGEDYYLAGAPDGPDGEFDIPGHEWVQTGPNGLVGKHYNTGPFGATNWWSSDAPDGELLFVVKGRIDTWSPAKANWYRRLGYVHYHELITVADGTQHPDKVVWLKHTARTSFTLDGGPHPPVPGIPITPGVARNFLPNWSTPYGSQYSDFVRGIEIDVDGEDYYFAGAPDGPNGAVDIPGHEWVLTGPDRLVGLHYNTGPFGAAEWWSSDAPDGGLLYLVEAKIDTWSPRKARRYARRGFVHYHELVSVADGSLHPDKVVWLRHIATSDFTLDGGPHPPDPGIPMTPGIAFEFLPNWTNPYSP